MGKQLSLGFPEVAARCEPLEVPQATPRAPLAYEPYPKGKMLEAADKVTMIHRTGRTKEVSFAQLVRGRMQLMWPIANETLLVSLRTGHVVTPKALKEWRVEPNALHMARVAHHIARLEGEVAVEE